MGQAAEADDAQARFEKAWVRSDVEIPGSCYCRVEP